MKRVLFFLAAISALSCGHCSEEPTFDSCEKIYVEPNQISFSKNGIFVYLDNAWLATEAVHSDASGIYVSNFGHSKFAGWNCPKCGFFNSWLVNQCAKCNYR